MVWTFNASMVHARSMQRLGKVHCTYPALPLALLLPQDQKKVRLGHKVHKVLQDPEVTLVPQELKDPEVSLGVMVP
jgi:hypothetical protein